MPNISRNICKFVLPGVEAQLKILRFVMESDIQTMQKNIKLKNHTAFLLTEGEANFYFNDSKIRIKPGNLVFGFTDEKFRAEPNSGSKYLYIGFEGGRATELFRRYGVNKITRAFDGCESLIPIWSESLLTAGTDNTDVVAEAALLFAFSKLSRDSLKKDDILGRALNIIEDEYDNPEFTLAVLAKMLGYNQKYFSHIFKKELGMGFNEYLQNTRIKHAIFLFDHGIDSVKNVAYLCGFPNPFYFSHIFKKKIGISPKDYKNREFGNKDQFSNDEQRKI